MQKKNISIALLSTLLLVQMSFVMTNLTGAKAQTASQSAFIFGTGSGPVDLDPHYMWDSASADVADQVCEPLFANTLDENMEIVPRLAKNDGTWSSDNLEFTVDIKTGVKFHDGTPFNATAVKWNFDRLASFIADGETQIASLYQPLGGENVINETIVVDEDTVKFKLNYVYGPFKALLAFSGSYMMSPASTPEARLLEAGNDTLVGTGPFEYVEYVTDEKVTFKANADYHGGKPVIENMIFQVIADGTTRNQALLNGEIDMVAAPLPEFLEEFDDDPNVVLSDGPDRVIIQYFGMNCKSINLDWRNAIARSINYTYLIEEIMQDAANRMTSPVPEGIAYSKGDCPGLVNFDVEEARQILIDAGESGSLDASSSDADWVDAAEGSSPLTTINYTYNTDNEVRADIGAWLQEDLKQIGVKLVLDGITWPEYVGRLFGDKGKLGLFFIGWIPDINDPSNFLDSLLKSDQYGNSAQFENETIDGWLEDALTTTNTTERADLYDKAQCAIGSDFNRPWAYGYVGKGFDAWSTSVSNFPQNPLGKFWFADVELAGVYERAIDGFEVFSLLGLAFVAVFAIIIKRRK